jgi:hypothetical protein
MPDNVRDLMVRIARSALVAVLVLFVAVTPLSAILRPGYFEVDMRRPDGSFHVIAQDQTGLVAAMVPAVGSSVSTSRALHVRVDGACGDWSYYLVFYAVGDGYLIERHRTSGSCSLLYLASAEVVLVLRAPVDPASVRIVDYG